MTPATVGRSVTALALVIGGALFAWSRLSTDEPALDRGDSFTQLVSDDELAAYRRSLLAAATTPSTECHRPVLRGSARPGPATADVLAFGASDQPLGECVAAWREVTTAAQPAKRAVLERCGAILETALHAAVSHEDACSPHGLGGPPESGVGTVLFAGQALGERARVLADGGQVQEAMWILLEVIRLGQDHVRGHTDLLASMIGVAIVGQALEHATAILERAKPANVDELAQAVDALLASEPSFGEAAAGDPIRVALDFGLSQFEPPSWEPPGGKREGQPAPTTDPELRGRALELMVFGSEGPRRIAQLFPSHASLAECRRNLAAGPYGVMPSDGTVRTLVRQALVESGMAQFLVGWPQYIDKRAVAHASLIALRIRLEVLKRGCDRAALAQLARTPALGDAVRLTDGNGELVIAPPVWAVIDGDTTQHIRCTP